MSTQWAKYYEYPIPDPQANMAEFMLAYDIRSILANANLNFLRKDPDPEFANPSAFLASIVKLAIGLTQNNFAVKYAPPSWDAVEAGIRYAQSCFEWLRKLPVSYADQNSVSIFDAWVAGTGQLYGGHAPITEVRPSAGAPDPNYTGPISIFGQPQVKP